MDEQGRLTPFKNKEDHRKEERRSDSDSDEVRSTSGRPGTKSTSVQGEIPKKKYVWSSSEDEEPSLKKPKEESIEEEPEVGGSGTIATKSSEKSSEEKKTEHAEEKKRSEGKEIAIDQELRRVMKALDGMVPEPEPEPPIVWRICLVEHCGRNDVGRLYTGLEHTEHLTDDHKNATKISQCDVTIAHKENRISVEVIDVSPLRTLMQNEESSSGEMYKKEYYVCLLAKHKAKIFHVRDHFYPHLEKIHEGTEGIKVFLAVLVFKQEETPKPNLGGETQELASPSEPQPQGSKEMEPQKAEKIESNCYSHDQ